MANLSRRRFLTLSVATSAAALVPARLMAQTKAPIIWTGIVLGADASIKIYGDEAKAHLAIKSALSVIKEHETQLSIYDPSSSLSRLNKSGKLDLHEEQDSSLYQLTLQSKIINQNTDGLFDPTIQPLFEIYAKNKGYPSKVDLEKAKALIGIDKVETSNAAHLKFQQKGMALTFNGIAQGFITDKVRQSLNRSGYDHALINIGEYSAGTRPAKIGIADAHGSVFDIAVLRNQAIATSSPSTYLFPDGTSHILHPSGSKRPAIWDTVSVVAENAMLADGYSTALALAADEALAEKLVARGIVKKVILKNTNGHISHIA